MALRISVPREAVEAFCTRWRIRELAIFGSALRDDFRPDSDIDVLVDFEPDAHWGFMHLLEMTCELECILGRSATTRGNRWTVLAQNVVVRQHTTPIARKVVCQGLGGGLHTPPSPNHLTRLVP